MHAKYSKADAIYVNAMLLSTPARHNAKQQDVVAVVQGLLAPAEAT